MRKEMCFTCVITCHCMQYQIFHSICVHQPVLVDQQADRMNHRQHRMSYLPPVFCVSFVCLLFFLCELKFNDL